MKKSVWRKIKEWYYGDFRMDGFVLYNHKHWTSKIANTLVKFWLKEWKWIIGISVAIIGLILKLKP